MQQHKYHRFFLPILQKLYQEQQNENYVDVTDCFSGSDEQNIVILRNLNDSEFAIVKKDVVVDLIARHQPPPKFNGKILPLGIDYFETFVQEYLNANKKIPPVGFKSSAQE